MERLGLSQESEDEEAIAWIQYHPTQDSNWAPELWITGNEARQMYRIAQSIGSPEVYQSWQIILRTWRGEGRPRAPLLLGLGDELPT